MSKSDNLYCVACNFLWTSMSLFHFIFDDIMTQELYDASIAWSHDFGEIANWAGDEELFASSQIASSKINLSMTDEYGDYLIHRWADKLNTVAQNATAAHPELIS